MYWAFHLFLFVWLFAAPRIKKLLRPKVRSENGFAKWVRIRNYIGSSLTTISVRRNTRWQRAGLYALKSLTDSVVLKFEDQPLKAKIFLCIFFFSLNTGPSVHKSLWTFLRSFVEFFAVLSLMFKIPLEGTRNSTQDFIFQGGENRVKRNSGKIHHNNVNHHHKQTHCSSFLRHHPFCLTVNRAFPVTTSCNGNIYCACVEPVFASCQIVYLFIYTQQFMYQILMFIIIKCESDWECHEWEAWGVSLYKCNMF